VFVDGVEVGVEDMVIIITMATEEAMAVTGATGAVTTVKINPWIK